MPDFITIGVRDVFYAVGGAAFFGMTFMPLLQQQKFVSVPTVYVIVGALLALSPFALPLLDPIEGGLQVKVIEHVTELIVIVSLAGAGLAVDRRMGIKRWMSSWRLLLVCMPLTILAIVWGGTSVLGLAVPSAVLLAACLAPTDPVLARSVQVSGPGEGEEHEVQVALTAEAGLNDGLAFPFVYLALALVGLSQTAGFGELAASGELFRWAWYDLAYRVGMGILVGMGVGWGLSRIVYSPVGDAEQEGKNSGLTVMGATFLSYGVTELVSGYGFLAVFVAARTARHYARQHQKEGYEKQPHHFADQFESLLMALLLLWLGAFLASGIVVEASLTEWAAAVAIVFLVRPLAGLAALLGRPLPPIERGAMAFFGIRGMGSVFYLAYAQNSADFADIDVLWRVTALTILISVVVHGATAPLVVNRAREMRGMKPQAA